MHLSLFTTFCPHNILVCPPNIFDKSTPVTKHVFSTARAYFFHLRRIRQVRRCRDETCRRILVQALVICRLDYCNSVLSSLPSSTLQPLSSVLHTAARLMKDLSPRDHTTPTCTCTETTALASHPCPYLIQSPLPHVLASTSHTVACGTSA